MPARVTAALVATAPCSGADNGARPPRNLPIGVRAAETITGSREGSDIGGSRIWTQVSYRPEDRKIKSGRRMRRRSRIADSVSAILLRLRILRPLFYSTTTPTFETLKAETIAARYRTAAIT